MQRHAIDDHGPRHVRRLAPQFAVNEVTDTTRADADRWQRHRKIEYVDHRLAATAREQDERDGDADEATMERHAAFPDAKGAERLCEDALGAIEQHPAEAPACDHADGAKENEVVDLGRRPRGAGTFR